MADLSSILGGSSDTMDSLIVAYRNTQQSKIDELNDKKALLQSRTSFYSTFKTRLNSLVSQLDKFSSDKAITNFLAKSVSSSDKSIVSATAKDTALIGNHSIKVQQLAKNDSLISNRVSLSDSFGEAAGEQTFDITIGDKTAHVSVTFDGNETNEQAMKKIVTAINRTSDMEVNASFVKDTSSTGKISLSSKQTGSDNKIVFSQNSALSKFGLDPDTLFTNTNSRVVYTDTTAGYREDAFTNLDAKFELDGINIVRSSNTIEDALDGVTFTLLKSQGVDDSAISLSTTINSDSVQNYIKGLLTSINDIVSNISNNKDIRRNDSAMANLLQTIRSVGGNNFSNGNSDAIKYLSDLGIKYDNSGFLVISDKDLFTKKLEEDPQKVADLFIGKNGLASTISKIIEPYNGNNGIVQSKKKLYEQQLTNAKEKMDKVEERIDKEAESLKKQYQTYLQLLYQAQGQQSYMTTMSSSSGYIMY